MGNKENANWPFEYPNDPLTRAMAAAAGKKLPTAETNELDRPAGPSAIVGFSKARCRPAVEDNTNNHKEATMPTVKTQAAKKSAAPRSRRKASPVTTSFEPLVIEFVPEAKRPDTQPGNDEKGALRFSEVEQDRLGGDQLIGVMYNRKSILHKAFPGKTVAGWKVTMEPIFE